MDRIHLDLELSCIVGILPRERVEPQPIELELELELDLERCGDSGDLGASVNYATVDAAARFLAVEGRFRLIESLGLAILRLLLLPPTADEGRAAIRHASVRIAKPAVLREATPAVSLERDASWAAGLRATALPGGGRAHTLVSVPEVVARKVVLPAGAGLSEGVALPLAGGEGRLLTPLVAEHPLVVLQVVPTGG